MKDEQNVEEGKEGMMADGRRARLRQMLLSLRKRMKRYRQRLAALYVEINQNGKIAKFFFISAKAKYVSPDLRMASVLQLAVLKEMQQSPRRKKFGCDSR